MNFIFGASIGQRPVRNLCSVQEALTGGLDETALARERKLEATSDLAHGDERNRESLLLPNLQLGLLDSGGLATISLRRLRIARLPFLCSFFK